jgi:signal transduction histidine kinase
MSEASLRTILENTNSCYLLLDSHYIVISFNERAKNWCRDEMRVQLRPGLNLLRRLPEGYKMDAEEKLIAVLNGTNQVFEDKFEDRNGNTNCYRMSMARVAVANDIYGLVIASENITASKNQQVERDAMTAKIIKHNKVLEQFAFTVSHNLRAPVANIIGLCNLVKKASRMNEDDFLKCIDGLQFSVEKLDGVIKDLNSILHSNKESKDQMEVIGLSSLVQDILTSVSSAGNGDPLDVQTSFKVGQITSVRSYLHSIFFNLITNSIKYRRTEVPLQISIRTRKAGTGTILVFEDNGMGIDLKRHGNDLFGLYKKFNSASDGDGLGLYLVKNQVELLGGRITVRSKPNKGTLFQIELPGSPTNS